MQKMENQGFEEGVEDLDGEGEKKISRMGKRIENHEYTSTFDPDLWGLGLLQHPHDNIHYMVFICSQVSSSGL